MKIILNTFKQGFTGQRQDRNAVAQLKENNDYDLNYPNRRRINKAIENLSQVPNEKNIEFLLDVSKNLKYGTKIDLNKQPFNDWRTKLINAAESSISISDTSIRRKYQKELDEIKSDKNYSPDEKELLKQREDLLSKIDFNQINKLDKTNIKNIRNNLDYFVVSSEVPISQKLYILNRLNYFMSDDYKIDFQLTDKKNQVLAEMINDIVTDTPESKIPNIKEINQLHHGICASISICRKLLAYEDKAHYVDMILSELDDSDTMMVYDRNKLGTGTKIPVEKVRIDYKEALERGYRIVDTSAMNWMQVANTDNSNNVIGIYNPIDSIYYDAFTDSHFLPDISKELSNEHDYYRSLVKAKSTIGAYKAGIEKEKFLQGEDLSVKYEKLGMEQKYNSVLTNILYQFAGEDITGEQLKKIFNDLKSLEMKTSNDKSKITDYRKDFTFFTNEEDEIKKEKIEKFLQYSFPNQNIENLQKHSEDILELLEDTNSIFDKKSHAMSKRLAKTREIYEAASTFRAAKQMQLNIPQYVQDYMQKYNIKDSETLLSDNIDKLREQLKNGTLKPEIKEQLAKNFSIENDDEILEAYLDEMKNQVNTITTVMFDDFYHSLALLNRRKALLIQVENLKNAVTSSKNENKKLKEIAQELGVQNTVKAISDKLTSFENILNSEDCTNEQYLEVFNKLGYKSQLLDFKYNIEKIGDLIFRDENENVIKAFNLLNNLSQDAPREETQQKFMQLINNFNQASQLITLYKNMLFVASENGEILNTTNPKDIILKKLEDNGEIPSEKELAAFRRRFNQIDKLMANKENHIKRYSDLPKSYAALTPMEKEALQKYKKEMNNWYSAVKRDHKEIYKQIKEPLGNLHKEVGSKAGYLWSCEEGHSGLYSNQEVKIIEHMTDRPYYLEENGEVSIDKIKNGAYSGVSSTSVSHRRPAMHAQYIADIAPVKTKDGEETEIFFHDNTWGASEHEKNWVDKNGLTRTDYSNEYGGELGFITNDKYLNGNLVANILDKAGENKVQNIPSKKYKKIAGSGEDYKFPLLTDIITMGVSPLAISYAADIKNNFLMFPDIESLAKYSSNMTKAEILASLEKNKNVAANFNKIYEKLINRINGDGVFDKGIKTREDYDKLAPNDELKILLEKIAILKSYKNKPETTDFIECRDPQKIEEFKTDVIKAAREDFDYTFAKNSDILKYIESSSVENMRKMIENFSKENNFKIKTEDRIKIIKQATKVHFRKFNGSMKDTIDFLAYNFEQVLTKNTPQFENKSEKIEALTQKYKDILKNNNYMTSTKELKNSSIEKWIDKTFEPVTDEEFIEIFNKLRDMTTEDFNKLYNSTITNEDLGIKNYSGYDVLKEILAQRETTLDKFYNQIFLQEYHKDVETNPTIPEFQYNKFSKEKTNIAVYKQGKSFDEICSEIYSMLSFLNIEKIIGPFKQQYYEKYGVFPAFPTVKISTGDFDKAMHALYSGIERDVEDINAVKMQKRFMEIIDILSKSAKRYNSPDGLMSTKQLNANIDYFTEFIELCSHDETMEEIGKRLQKFLDSKTISLSDYKQLVADAKEEIYKYEMTMDGKTLDAVIQSHVKSIQKQKKIFIENIFDKNYKAKGYEMLSQWLNAQFRSEYEEDPRKAKQKVAEADRYYQKFKQLYEKHQILYSPEKFLEEFMLINAKDSELNEDKLQTEKAKETKGTETSDKTSNKDAKLTNDEKSKINKPPLSEERKQELEDRKKDLEIALHGLLFKSKMLNLQFLLRRCLQSGNLNQVSEAFKNLQIEMCDYSHIPLASDEGLNMILSPLLSDSNLDVLVEFVNKMNLSEKIIEIVSDNQTFVDAKVDVKRIHSILSSADKQAKFINKELEKLKDLDNAQNYKEILEEFKTKITKKANQTNYRQAKSIYIAAVDDAIKQMETPTKISKYLILKTNMNVASRALAKVVEKEVLLRNEELKRISQIRDLLNRLELPQNSKHKQMVENYNKLCEDLIAYQDTFPSDYQNIALHTDR